MKVKIGVLYGCGDCKVKVIHIEKNRFNGGVLDGQDTAFCVVVRDYQVQGTLLHNVEAVASYGVCCFDMFGSPMRCNSDELMHNLEQILPVKMTTKEIELKLGHPFEVID